MSKKIKTTVVSAFEASQEFFEAPAKFYYKNAVGDHVYIHCRSRADAENYIAEQHGKGFYKLRTSSLEKSSGDLTCTGANTRKGFSPRLKGLRG